MKQLDLCNKDNLLNLKDINLGFAVPNIIAKLRSDIVTLAEVKEFKVGTEKFIIGMIAKLFERSPLGSNFSDMQVSLTRLFYLSWKEIY